MQYIVKLPMVLLLLALLVPLFVTSVEFDAPANGMAAAAERGNTAMRMEQSDNQLGMFKYWCQRKMRIDEKKREAAARHALHGID
uniref:Secreted protein n=1 Tax=Globodera pallida TaxID=36090 RepID=A0A183CLA5_GLOPA